MAWSRGFFRLWVVASGAWILWAAMYVRTAYNETASLHREYHISGAPSPEQWLTDFVLMTFGPPLAVLVFGLSLGWLIGGFRRNEG